MKFKILFITFILLLNGCGGKLAPNHIHEAPATKPKVEANSSSNDLDIADKMTKMAISSEGESSEAILKNSTNDFFDIKNWRNPKIKLSKEFTNVIDRVAKSILDLGKTKKADLTEQKVWSRLGQLVDQLCDEDLQNCEIVEIMKTSAEGAELLRQLANEQTSLTRKYKYLFISMDIQNQNFPTNIIEDILLTAKDYRIKLIADVELARKSGQSVELIKRQTLLSKMNSLLALVITFVQEGKIKTANTDWIRDLDLASSVKESDTQLVAKYMVFVANTHQLTAEFQREITKNQSIIGSFSEKKKLIEENNLKALSSFEVQSIALDEYFYVIDQVYTDRWSARQGSAFIKTAGLSVAKLLEVAQNYVRFEVVYAMTRAQLEFKSFLADYSSVTAPQIIVAAKKKISMSSMQARALPEKTRKLSQLISDAAGVNSKESNIFNKQIISIPKTIKTAITYPYMAILLFIARRLGANTDTHLEVVKFSGEGNSKLSYFVKHLFNGSLIPILDFTDDMVPLNAFEVMEAFEISAKSGTFENLGLNLDEVTATLYNLLLEDEQKDLASNQSNLERKYATTEWSELMQICQGYKQHTPAGHAISFPELQQSPTLGEAASPLNDSFTEENTSTLDGVTIKKHGYFTMSVRLVDQLEWIRSDLFTLIQYFDNMQTILMQSSGYPMPKLKVQVEKTKVLSKNFISLLLKRDKEFDECFIMIQSQERKYMTQIVKYELAYWKLVHQEMVRQRRGLPGKDMGTKFLNLTLPPSIEYRSKVSAKNVKSVNFDFFLRVKSYLQYGLPAANLPAIYPNLDIAWTTGLEDSSFYRDTNTHIVPFDENELSFASAAVIASNIAGSGSQTFWFGVAYMYPSSFRQYYDAKALFYRMNPQVKKILGMDSLISIENLMQVPKSVIPYIDLTEAEKQIMNLLGILSRYSDTDLPAGHGLFLDNTNNNAAPLYDYLLAQLSNRWMASFGHADEWEDYQVESSHMRPFELRPISMDAELFSRYQANVKDHFALIKLVTADVFAETLKSEVKDDLQLLIDARNAISNEAKKDFPISTVSYQSDQSFPLTFYSSSVYDNVDKYIYYFHSQTSGFYK